MTKLQPGDRCEVHIESIDRWRPATILTTYPGHGGHMVITDSGRNLHMKNGKVRPLGESARRQALERTNPDPHHPAYQGEVGDHQQFDAGQFFDKVAGPMIHQTHQPGLVTHDGTISEVTIEVEPKINGIRLKTRNHPRIEAEQHANNARRDESLHLITAMYRGAW